MASNSKKTNGFLNEKENLDQTRLITRLIYMYGAYSLNDFMNQKLLKGEASKFKALIRNIENYMNSNEFQPNELLVKQKLPNRKTDSRARRFSQNPLNVNFNFLASIFHQHTVDIDDIIFYLYLSLLKYLYTNQIDTIDYESILCDFIPNITDRLPEDYLIIDSPLCDFFSDDAIRLSYDDIIFGITELLTAHQKIIKSISSNNYEFDEFEENLLPSDDVLKRRISEFIERGYLKKVDTNDGSNSTENMVCFAKNLFDLNLNDYSHFKNFVEFGYNHSFLSVPAYFLYEKAKLMTSMSDFDNTEVRNRLHQEPTPFYSYQNNYQNIIDDDVAWIILNAIHQKNILSFTYRSPEISNTAFRMFPIKLIQDTNYGRRYVFGWIYQGNSTKKGHFVARRLDKMYSVDIVSSYEELSQYKVAQKELTASFEEEYKEWSANMWNVTDTSPKKLFHILIHFKFEENEYGKYALDYYQKTNKLGHSICIDKDSNRYDFSIDLKNYSEILPWLNSFGNMAVVDAQASPELYSEIKKYNQEILSLYE